MASYNNPVRRTGHLLTPFQKANYSRYDNDYSKKRPRISACQKNRSSKRHCIRILERGRRSSTSTPSSSRVERGSKPASYLESNRPQPPDPPGTAEPIALEETMDVVGSIHATNGYETPLEAEEDFEDYEDPDEVEDLDDDASALDIPRVSEPLQVPHILQWIDDVVPGPPQPEVLYPDDIIECNVMSLNKASTTMDSSFTGRTPGIKKTYGKSKIVSSPANYKYKLEENRIHLRASRLQLPEWVDKFVKKVVFSSRYKDTPRPPLLDLNRTLLLHKLDQYSLRNEGTVESFMATFLPLSAIEATKITLSTSVPPVKSDKDLSKQASLRHLMMIDSCRQPFKFDHLRGFPTFSNLSQPCPDLICGYTNEVLPSNLPQFNRSHFEETCNMNTETTCFPYLIAEAKSSSNGNMEVATLQLLGDCAVALSASKKVLSKYDHPIFGITYDNSIFNIYVMWIEGTLGTTSFVMQQISTIPISPLQGGTSISIIQDYLMNIHDWAFEDRLELIREELEVEHNARTSGKPRPPPPFESRKRTIIANSSENLTSVNSAAAKPQDSAMEPVSSNVEAESGEPHISTEALQTQTPLDSTFLFCSV
ncbi:hypothetical protein GGR54DRAFT_55066 [Hypoxylon sp. NC1633]|nr:hypothetical protein GGR54DRAFT_55066 [Hypoxylon sp. NC1633]